MDDVPLTGGIMTNVDEWCITEIEQNNFKFLWTINNFISGPNEPGAFIESSKFSSGSNKLEWILKVYPRVTYLPEVFDYICLSLSIVPSNDVGEARADVKLAILSAERKEVHARKLHGHDFRKCSTLTFKYFIARDSAYKEGNTFLPNGNLTIFCEISLNVPLPNVQFKVPSCCLIEDFNNLFANQKLSDVTLCASGREFHVHKAVLGARSPVFSAMFDHAMVENELNWVKIDDINPKVLAELLRYIYTGKLSNIEGMTDQLFMAADKYALERVKVMCTEILCLDLSLGNAIETLIFADLYSAIELKAKAIQFICRNASEIMETPRFKGLLTSHPHLLMESWAYLAQHILPKALLSKQ